MGERLNGARARRRLCREILCGGSAGMSAVDDAYATYAEEAQRLARIERDIHATPRQRRTQALVVTRAWWKFLDATRPKPRAIAAVETGDGPARRRVEFAPPE